MTATADSIAEIRGPMRLADLLRVAEDVARQEGNESMASILRMLAGHPRGLGTGHFGHGSYCCVQCYDGSWMHGWVMDMSQRWTRGIDTYMDASGEIGRRGMPGRREVSLTMVVADDSPSLI